MNLGTYTWYLLLINVVNWVAGFWFGRWYEQRQSRQTQEPRIPIPKFLTDAFRETVQRSMVAEETSSGRLVRQSGVVTAVDPAAQEATVSFMVVGHDWPGEPGTKVPGEPGTVTITAKTKGLDVTKLEVDDVLECHIKDGAVQYAFVIPQSTDF